jgi:hypothetical protein
MGQVTATRNNPKACGIVTDAEEPIPPTARSSSIECCG